MEEKSCPYCEKYLNEIALLKQQVADLKAQVDKLTKMLFGKKSEKSKKKNQETEASSDDSSSGDANTSKKKRKKNGGGGRKPFPPEIPRRDVHVDLSPDECRCDCCGEVFEPMGIEITEVLNSIPMICEVKIPDLNHPPPQESGCNAHCRRGFKDSEKTEPDWSKRFLDIYKKLYQIEAEIKSESVALRYARRQSDSVPLWDVFFDLCRECKADTTVLPKSPLGQACSYTLKNENALRCYGTDGRLSIDNNISERTLREFVIGRKNWLFFGSPEAAKFSANIMSVLSSARRHGLNEWEYLVDVLYRLSDWNSKRDSFENLLPDHWSKSSIPPSEAAALMAR